MGASDVDRTRLFAALRYRNFRIWFFAQLLSLIGTWMQNVATSWLMFEMTRSRLALGMLSFASTLPMLVLMLPAGAVADRLPRRQLLMGIQAALMIQAFALAGLAAVGILQPWHLVVWGAWWGVANSFDVPTRHALVVELVDDRRVWMNAIALNSLIFNLARVIGPALAGFTLAILGPAWCFTLNGVSFMVVIGGLLAMTGTTFRPSRRPPPLRHQMVEGIRYVWHHSMLRMLIALTATAAFFGIAYITLLPAYAAEVLHLRETGYGLLNTGVGVGAMTGALIVAAMYRSRRRIQLLQAGSFGVPLAMIALALCRHRLPAAGILFLAGLAFVLQFATTNTLIQSIVLDRLRGRVMSIYMLMIFGMTPFGALLAGFIAQMLGLSLGLALSGIVALVMIFSLWIAHRGVWTVEPWPVTEDYDSITTTATATERW